MQMIPIHDLNDQAALGQFSRLAADVYRANPIWVPQSEGYFQQTCAAARVSRADFLPVIGLVNEQVVARAAAIFNPRAGMASIGFIEHLPGAQAECQAVLACCEQHLRRRGALTVQAPRADNQWMGLLISGFDLPQTIFTPHNPPEYRQTLLQSGYREVENLVTFRFTRSSVKTFSLAIPGIRTRSFERSRLEKEARIFNLLQTHIFAPHSGYVARTLEEDRAMLSTFLPFLDDDLVIIAEDAWDQPVGLLICLPDIYQAYQGRPVDSARLISIGVLPGWKYKGCGALMVSHLVRTLLDKGYQSLEASWIKASNTLPQNLALRFGGKPGREFALFEKDLQTE